MRIPYVTSVVLFAVFLLCSLWLALVVVSPYLVPHGTLTDLTGVVGARDNVEQFKNLDPLPKAIYSIGDAECHQIKERSYFLNDNQMPFCARDLGMFIGLAAGFGIAAFFRFKLNPLYLMLGLIPMGIDGGLQVITDYESTNPLRLLTGITAGVALSLILGQFAFLMQEDRQKATHAPRV